MPAGITLQIDPTSEDANNVPLTIVDGTTYFLLAEDYPDPDLDATYATSVDTEGDPLVEQRYRNTKPTVTLRVIATSYQNLQTAIFHLQQKAGKIKREGGTLKRTLPSGTSYVLDLVAMRVNVPQTRRLLTVFRAEVNLEFEALPGWLGDEEDLSIHNNTGGAPPAVVFTETDIKGDMPALGRLHLQDRQGVDQMWLTWGLQSRYYDADATAELILEAEDLTPINCSVNSGADAATASGGSMLRTTANGLADGWSAVLSTQVSGGNHLSHVGDFQVYARVRLTAANTGALQVALEWGVGDLRKSTRNTPVRFPDAAWNNSWRLVDLGQVHLPPVASGTQQWEGRVLARNTSTFTNFDVDYLMLVPVTEGSGRAKGLISPDVGAAYAGFDDFNVVTGVPLTASGGGIGIAWAGAGDADDFNLTGGHAARTAVSDSAGVGRYGIAQTASVLESTVVQVDIATTVGVTAQGVIARYFNTNNWVRARVYGGSLLYIEKRNSGTVTDLHNNPATLPVTDGTGTLRFVVSRSGNWQAYFGDDETSLQLIAEGYDSDLAHAGTLNNGYAGIYDEQDAATPATRTYDRFRVWDLREDAAVFASENLEIRHDCVIREDSSGALWTEPSSYEGDFLRIPPAGLEDRTLRMIAKATRSDPTTGPDDYLDELQAQLHYRPRYLVLPE